MDAARMRALLAPFHPGDTLSPHQLSALTTYLHLLLRWNARMNLTAVRDPGQIVTRHFGESLFAAHHLFPCPPHPAARLIDIGSGAGFPGLPIKICRPALHLALIEAKYRKTIFLRELLRALELPDVEVFAGRLEAYAPAPAASLTLTLRAVERFHEVLPVAARLLHRTAHATIPGSSPHPPMRRLALLIGASQIDQARQLAPQLAWAAPLTVPLSSARVLLVGALE